MTEFEAAAHQLLGVIAEALKPALGYKHKDDVRLIAVQIGVEALVADLVMCQKFPTLTDQPAKDVRRTAERIRERIRIRLAEAAERAA